MALPAAPLSLVSGACERARGFVDLDERLAGSGAQPGVVIVRAPHDVHAPILAHAARRLRTSGYVPLEAPCSFGAAGAGAPLFREVATQLGLSALPTEPSACADAIAQAAHAKRAAIVAPLPAEGTWDRSVLAELARASRSQLLVLVTSGEAPTWESASISTFDVVGDLTASDKLRWLGAVAEEAHSDVAGSDLRSLEAWWANARRASTESAVALEGLGETARAVLSCLALAGRSIPVASLSTLGDDAVAAVEELAAAGAVVRPGALVALSSSCDAHALAAGADSGARLATARILASGPGGGPGFDPDPWAYARAAELLVSAGVYEAADAAIAKAVRGLDDPKAAYEITSRWFSAVTPLVGDEGFFLRVRAAERALAQGEANEAQRWCETAAALRPGDATTALLMGKALMQLGDLVASRVSLQKAQAAAADDEMRARIASELAEVSYLAGDLTQAKAHATRGIELATSATTRLAGRNTLGKILLAEAQWDAADEHFADDALAASAAGVGAAELRARLNRGIALMSKGLLDDARGILERVLDDGGKAGEDRARAHAHSNLGVIAYRQHDYASALSHWDATTRFPQALRGRMATALTIANLAELRLRLGLVDHAEHAVAFGRRLLTGSGSPARAAHFKRVAAQIALVRKNSELARREIDAALVDAESSSDRDVLDAVCIVAARVALDDGDTGRAAVALERATHHATSDRAKAEVGILVAQHLRASGKDALPAATEALTLARASGQEDLLAEIHVLLAVLHRDAGDLQAAQAHCCRAIAVRDQVAAGLAPDIRAAFLAKPEIVALSRLQTALASSDAEVEEETPRTQRIVRSEAGPAREIIGDDPQIKNLLVAIRKVARSNSTVLIRGESGTGKELVADALHRASERSTGPLVSVNCAALVETLLLSELFGHEKGAFTGATSRRRGRFEMAEGGTLFLDEIGDISARTQVALLRVLQEKTFERVGGTQPIRANVRVVCATHRDLKAMVERGEFREDLYYRLRGITLEVPALRARLGDLPKIADHLLGRIALERSESPKSIDRDAVELLQRHRWPGNIRELENVLRAVSLFAEGEVITATDLIDNVEDLRTLAQSGPASSPPMSLRGSLLPPPPVSLGNLPVPSGSLPDDEGGDLEDGALPEGESGATAVAYAQVRQGAVSLSDMKRQIERDCIARALAETKGNITRAATLLGMKRPRLSQLVKQYGLSSASSEGSQ